ncbi:hypothetical protein BT96DRAFT_319801 [Gymnopus androsaceus JB14]|uniref:Uncharacterized protein n=1 Tax=Gymnopus androsaceus JB14 TaxID=1447944 RepID=A0A6A4H1U1_9AGAR|nr:hypothetical protein BT96DRAFT_319801 [Gymnopus androsaceus JB14]
MTDLASTFCFAEASCRKGTSHPESVPTALPHPSSTSSAILLVPLPSSSSAASLLPVPPSSNLIPNRHLHPNYNHYQNLSMTFCFKLKQPQSKLELDHSAYT